MSRKVLIAYSFPPSPVSFRYDHYQTNASAYLQYLHKVPADRTAYFQPRYLSGLTLLLFLLHFHTTKDSAISLANLSMALSMKFYFFLPVPAPAGMYKHPFLHQAAQYLPH